MNCCFRAVTVMLAWFLPFGAVCGAISQSHPVLHKPVFSEDRTIPENAVWYVDPVNGSDENAGTQEQPWKTIQHAIVQLQPGDTLLLRGGIYYENVYCAVSGTADQPITIRGYPGEVAIIDGGLQEFQEDPAGSWEPGEAEGEFVSTRSWPNLRDILGLFGDSNVGLQTYWYRDDLIAQTEVTTGGNVTPFYAGPGIWYDARTGKIHVRLAHTHQDYPDFANYQGETDPRKLPLVIAPFRSVPLHLDQAMHLRFRDLVIRGGGYNTLVMNFAVNVEFEYVTVFGGAYCIRSKNSGPIKMVNCGVFGQIPPWGFFSDNGLQSYNGTWYSPWTRAPENHEEIYGDRYASAYPREYSTRNVARLPTHALLVTEGMEEYDIFAFPFNNHWEIANCEFADAHDGIYLNARHSQIHHSLIYRLQDDGFYLSSPSPSRISDDLHIRQNYIAGSMTPFGAHLRGHSSGKIYVYGNVVDMRYPSQVRRATPEQPAAFHSGLLFLAHGRGDPRGMESIGFYHNTFIASSDRYSAGTMGRLHPASVRQVMNNIFVYYKGLSTGASQRSIDANPAGRVDVDGNLHWSPVALRGNPAEWIARLSESNMSRKNVSEWGGLPWETHGKWGDPQFAKWDADRKQGVDFRLQPSSPARGMAVEFPDSVYLKGDVVGPNVGAIQGDQPLKVGINGRVRAGDALQPAFAVQPFAQDNN